MNLREAFMVMAWSVFLIGGFRPGSAVAYAQSRESRVTFRLEYSAAGECADRGSFADGVRGRLGYDPFVAPGEEHDTPLPSAEVRIVAEGTSWAGALRIRTATGEIVGSRELVTEGEECQALVRALAATFSIALTSLEFPPVEAPLPSSEQTADPVQASDAEEPWAEERQVLEPEAQDTLHAYIALSARVSGWETPGTAAGGFVEFGLEWDNWVLALRGGVQKAIRTPLGIEAHFLGGSLIACVGGKHWSACPLLRLGVLQVRAVDSVEQRLHSSVIGFAGLLGRLRVPLREWLALRLGASLEIPFVRTTLLVDGFPRWTAPPLGASLEFDVVFRFM